MIGEILYAVQQEVLAFLAGGPGTVIHHTMFNVDNWPSYSMPLITIKELPGEDFDEKIGGWTLCDWTFELSAYNVTPDMAGIDPTNYSATRINVIDELRQHFKTYRKWLSVEMPAAESTYGLKWTLSRVEAADPLEHPSGQVDGYKLSFSTLSWDVSTRGTDEISPLQTIQQLNPPPAH